jgi:hypothetical protein
MDQRDLLYSWFDGSMPDGEFQLSVAGLSGMPPPYIVHARVNVTSSDDEGAATFASAVSQPITLVSSPVATEYERTAMRLQQLP